VNRSPDLTDVLRDWEYDENNNVRFITGEDGRDLMQIRQPMGIEQYDLDGRPDGRRPEGELSWLDYYLREEANKEHSGVSFVLGDTDFQRLRSEGIFYYFRYLALFQMGQYDRVSRDTEHNLAIINLLERCYQNENRLEMLQYRPYIRRMNAISKAMLFLADNDTDKAIEELESGLGEIEGMEAIPTPNFEFEKLRSTQHLAEVISQVRNARQVSSTGDGFRARLNAELNRAVDAEDYERAANLRDRLRRLG